MRQKALELNFTVVYLIYLFLDVETRTLTTPNEITAIRDAVNRTINKFPASANLNIK